LAKDHWIKRRHEFATSTLARPLAVNLVIQRLKNLREIDDADEGLARVALQKREIIAPEAPVAKKAKKSQPVVEPRASVLLLPFHDASRRG